MASLSSDRLAPGLESFEQAGVFVPQVIVTLDAKSIAAADDLLGRFPKRARGLILSALNEAVKAGRTIALRAVSRALNIPQKYLLSTKEGGATSARYGRFITTWATAHNLSASFRITGKRIPVFRFHAQPSDPKAPSRPGGVRWDMGDLGRRRAPHAFVRLGLGMRRGRNVREGTSGHIAVFQRASESPKHISVRGRWEHWVYQLMGPSIPRVAKRDAALAEQLQVDLSAKIRNRLMSKRAWLYEQANETAPTLAGTSDE